MKRRKYADGEQDQVQKIRSENKRLKLQISQLRKQLSRVDLDRFQNIKELLDSQDKEEHDIAAEAKNKTLAEQWKCWKCDSGHLRLIIIDRRDGPHYSRNCDYCKNRTRMKKYHDKVKDGPR